MSNVEECIKPSEIGERLDKLINNGVKKILILGPPTGGKTEHLIKYYSKYYSENRSRIYYIHAHKINSKYSGKNNVHEINENKIKNKEIIIVDDIYRALLLSENLKNLKKIIHQDDDKTIILVTTPYRWNWLIDEACAIKGNCDTKYKRTNNALRGDQELAEFFLNFNEECTSILVGYEKCEDIPKNSKNSQDNFCKYPKQYRCYYVKLHEEVEKRNDNIKNVCKRLEKHNGTPVIYPFIYAGEVKKFFENVISKGIIADKPMVIAKIIGDILKDQVKHLLEHHHRDLTTIGSKLFHIASMFIPTSVFAFSLLLGAYWKRKKEREEELPDFVKKLLEFKEAPDYFLENVEQENNLPPLTLETIQLIFDDPNKKFIFNELKKIDNEIKNIEDKLKNNIEKRFEIIEKINEIVVTNLLSRIIPATNIRDPMADLKMHLEIRGENLEIPEIENLKVEFESDKEKFGEIIKIIERSKAEENLSIIIVKGVSGSGKTTFIYNLVKKIKEDKNWDIVMFEKIGDLEIFAAEIANKSNETGIDIKKYILKGDKKILYCIYKDSVSVIGSDAKVVGELQESTLNKLIEIIKKGLFDSIIIECRDEWFNELNYSLENSITENKLKFEKIFRGNFNININNIEIKRNEDNLKILFNKFKEISKNISDNYFNELKRLCKEEYSLLIAILLLIWMHNKKDISKYKTIKDFLKDYARQIYRGEGLERAALTALAAQKYVDGGIYIPVEMLREAIFWIIVEGKDDLSNENVPISKNRLKDLRKYKKFLVVAFYKFISEYPQYYTGFVKNCELLLEKISDYDSLKKLGELIKIFFEWQIKFERSLNYPTIYTNTVKKLLKILVELREKIKSLEGKWSYSQLSKPDFPDPSKIRWENFVVDLFVKHNIKKVSVPLVAHDNVDFPDDYIDKILKELPEYYMNLYESDIKKELKKLESFKNELLSYIFNAQRLKAKERREFSEKLLELAEVNKDFDSTFYYHCLYLWKLTYGIIDSFNVCKKLENLEITIDSVKEFSYVINFPIYCDETIKECGILNYDILKAGFRDSPNIHFLKNLVNYSDEKYLIPQLREDYWTKIKEYGNLWFTKEAYEAGALVLIMTLGGAWLLKDDFIYKGDHDVAFFIQHPFQEKVLAEILNLQNPRYPFEMIRHWYKWEESRNNKVIFIWIRESVQPVGNIIKVTENIEKKLSSNEKKHCWRLIKKELEVKERDLLLQFQVHDHFVRTRTSAVQLITKSNSKLMEIVEKFLARQVALAEIFGYKTEKEKALKLLKVAFPAITESVDSINNNIRYSNLEKIETEMKNTIWFVYPEKWVSYGEKEAFKVLNPSAILLREIYMANLMLKVIDCYIKQTEEKNSSKMDVTKINLLFSKYSILSFLYEHYFDEVSLIEKGNNIDIKKNISNLEILRRELKDLKSQCEESLKTIKEDLEFVKNNKSKISKLLGRSKEDIDYWEKEVDWLIENMKKLKSWECQNWQRVLP